MSFSTMKPYIYQEMKRDGFDFKVGYFQLSTSQLGLLTKYIKKFGYKYTSTVGKSQGRAFYDSMVKYHDKVSKR